MKYYRVSLIDNFASCACNRVRRTRVIIDRRFNKRNEGSSPLSRETRCRRRRGGGRTDYYYLLISIISRPTDEENMEDSGYMASRCAWRCSSIGLFECRWKGVTASEDGRRDATINRGLTRRRRTSSILSSAPPLCVLLLFLSFSFHFLPLVTPGVTSSCPLLPPPLLKATRSPLVAGG